MNMNFIFYILGYFLISAVIFRAVVYTDWKNGLHDDVSNFRVLTSLLWLPASLIVLILISLIANLIVYLNLLFGFSTWYHLRTDSRRDVLISYGNLVIPKYKEISEQELLEISKSYLEDIELLWEISTHLKNECKDTFINSIQISRVENMVSILASRQDLICKYMHAILKYKSQHESTL